MISASDREAFAMTQVTGKLWKSYKGKGNGVERVDVVCYSWTGKYVSRFTIMVTYDNGGTVTHLFPRNGSVISNVEKFQSPDHTADNQIFMPWALPSQD